MCSQGHTPCDHHSPFFPELSPIRLLTPFPSSLYWNPPAPRLSLFVAASNGRLSLINLTHVPICCSCPALLFSHLPPPWPQTVLIPWVSPPSALIPWCRPSELWLQHHLGATDSLTDVSPELYDALLPNFLAVPKRHLKQTYLKLTYWLCPQPSSSQMCPLHPCPC